MVKRNTRQRELILDIVNNSCNHLNAISIYGEARLVLPNISLGTVYRDLSDLEKSHDIRKIRVDNVDRYDNLKCRHNHFVCNDCKKIIDVFEDRDDYNKDINGNIVIDYEVYYKGICKECLKEEM